MVANVNTAEHLLCIAPRDLTLCAIAATDDDAVFVDGSPNMHTLPWDPWGNGKSKPLRGKKNVRKPFVNGLRQCSLKITEHFNAVHDDAGDNVLQENSIRK